jgi:hypothetical protein
VRAGASEVSGQTGSAAAASPEGSGKFMDDNRIGLVSCVAFVLEEG